MNHVAALAVSALAFATSVTAVAADTYPSKLVRIIVPFAAGGSTDLFGRAIAQTLNEAWRQPVIVENRAGGGAIPGSDYVARQRPDGYTLLVGTVTTHAVAASLYPRLPYDIQRDFAPITELAFIPQLLSVHPSLPARSVKELVALARERPGEINYAGGGFGATPHMTMELFQQVANVKMTHIQYRGSGPAMIGLLSGEASAMFDVAMTTLPHMIRDIGKEWLITQSYFKLYCTGRYTHSAIDALLDAQAKAPGGRIDPSQIERIDVDAYGLCAYLGGKNITTSFGARFSVPFALATILHHGHGGLSAFDDAAVANPLVQNLVSRVAVTSNQQYTDAFPEKQLVDLNITLKDGTVITGHCDITKGEPANPHQAEELRAKFFDLGTPAWGEAVTQKLFDGLMTLETIDNFRHFADGFKL